MGLTRPYWREVRARIQELLLEGSALHKSTDLQAKIIVPLSKGVQMHLPATIGDYTDFYSSKSHAYNVGVLFRGKDNALQPNWLHIPVILINQ